MGRVWLGGVHRRGVCPQLASDTGRDFVSVWLTVRSGPRTQWTGNIECITGRCLGRGAEVGGDSRELALGWQETD